MVRNVRRGVNFMRLHGTTGLSLYPPTADFVFHTAKSFVERKLIGQNFGEPISLHSTNDLAVWKTKSAVGGYSDKPVAAIPSVKF